MALYYLDLDIDNNPGYQVNDPNNPMGWFDYTTMPSPYVDQFKVRGQRYDHWGQWSIGEFSAWDLELYGPWRLMMYKPNIRRASTQIGFPGPFNISDGIIRSINFLTLWGGNFSSNLEMNFNNMVFMTAPGTGMRWYTSGPCSFYHRGNTFALEERLWTDNGYAGQSIYIKDSVVDGNMTNAYGYAYPAVMECTNSVFSRSQVDLSTEFGVGWSDTDCQFDYVGPTWPDWGTSVKEDWQYETLGTGITIPGTGNYAGYEFGLWGSPRRGVGAFYFPIINTYYSELSTGKNIDVSLGNISVISLLQPSRILTDLSVQSKPNFDNESKWQAVIKTYKHPNGQYKTFVHKKVGADWISTETFSTFANPGIWQAESFVFVDKMGDRYVVPRSEYSDVDDITITN